jgi:hypothetical protein
MRILEKVGWPIAAWLCKEIGDFNVNSGYIFTKGKPTDEEGS